MENFSGITVPVTSHVPNHVATINGESGTIDGGYRDGSETNKEESIVDLT